MRWCPRRVPPRGAVVVAAGVVASALASTGCSHGAHGGGAPASSAPQPSETRSPVSAAPRGIGLSAAGVTTRVDVPADSTEEQYFQACHAARQWMDAQPKTGASLFEPYLAMVQASPSGAPGTWNSPWPELTLPRQAAVIVAARAAANDECG